MNKELTFEEAIGSKRQIFLDFKHDVKQRVQQATVNLGKSLSRKETLAREAYTMFMVIKNCEFTKNLPEKKQKQIVRSLYPELDKYNLWEKD